MTLRQFDAATERKQIELARSDLRAFGPLYDRYVDPVYRYCYRRTGSHTSAEDLTAQTFRQAIESLPAYEWRGAPFGAWLFRIAHNLVADQLKKKKAVSLDGMVEDGFDPAGNDDLPDAQVVACQERDAAWQEVAKLPPMQRRALTLYFGRDMTHAEVGRVIGRSEPATRQLVFRGVQTLRSRLSERE